MKEDNHLQIRIHGDASSPALIYLPGLHGDWTLVSSFRECIKPYVRFVEFTYPRTLTWSLDDYAAAVRSLLEAHGIREGVVLGESFGSQIAWPLIAEGRNSCRPELNRESETRILSAIGDRSAAAPFRATALILAGGFARYPIMPLLDLALALWKVTPNKIAKLFFKGYAVFARWRHRHASETAAAIKEFVARRTPGDLAAMGHRLNLIRRTDPSVLARSIDVPVYSLAGTIDPIVCHWAVRKWLQRNCPGFRESRVIWPADHNVLSTTPDAAAAQVRQWMDFKDGTNSRLSPSNFPV